MDPVPDEDAFVKNGARYTAAIKKASRYDAPLLALQRNNNFDLVRLIASLAVIFGHSFWILPTDGRVEPVLKFTKIEYSGSLAVYAFFLMSGILVSKSFDTQRSRAVFALHRAARIYPAFAICTIITAFVLGPTISTLPIREYLSDPMTMHWWWHTITLCLVSALSCQALCRMRQPKAW